MSKQVREFTVGAGQECPDFPQVSTIEEVQFISKMILDEVMELMATVLPPSDAKTFLVKTIFESKNIHQIEYDDSVSQIADQADALVDIEYYMHNHACKKGINLKKLFKIVHAANMAKRDPVTNQFLKREDGKIIKPEGWQPPDIEAEIERQLGEGSWV